MKNFTIRRKILALLTIVIVMLAGVLAYSYAVSQTMSARIDDLFAHEFAVARMSKQLAIDLGDVRVALLNMFEYEDAEVRNNLRTRIRELTKSIDENFDHLSHISNMESASRENLTKAHRNWELFRDTRDTELIPAIMAGKIVEARALAMGVQRDRYENFRTAVEALENRQEQRFGESVQSTQSDVGMMRVTLIVVAVAALTVCVVAVFLAGRLATPIRHLAAAAHAISVGDINQRIDYRSSDEVGQLAESFRDMIAYIKGVAEAVDSLRQGNLKVQVTPRSANDALSTNFNNAVTALAQMTHRTVSAVSSITASTSETSAGIAEMTTTAHQQATAVAKTTSTIDELRQSSDEVADRAKNVAALARDALHAAEEGQRSMGETVDGMQRIAERTESIARSILALSEQTQAVGKITASVNDIAEQSKMLAFNASIEAAKAGEFGKGFAVVATEIRTLAEQSKAATAQIADILRDIQKAAESSVMVTEEGSKEAERGMHIAKAAGERICSISDSVRKTAQMAMQIESASDQQARGMDQITRAMSNINAATTQAQASSAQMNRAMHDLNALASQLAASVKAFQL